MLHAAWLFSPCRGEGRKGKGQRKSQTCGGWLHRPECFSVEKIWSRWGIIRDYKTRGVMHGTCRGTLLSTTLVSLTVLSLPLHHCQPCPWNWKYTNINRAHSHNTSNSPNSQRTFNSWTELCLLVDWGPSVAWRTGAFAGASCLSAMLTGTRFIISFFSGDEQRS